MHQERPTWFYWLGWIAARTGLRLYFRAKIYNAERMPSVGPVIVASNHASYLDPPIVGAAVPRPLNFLARESLFQLSPVRWILTRWNAIPVDRDSGGAAGLKEVMDRLQHDAAVLLFPEGTRSRDGRLQSPRSGIGLVVMKTAAPVVPVRIFNSHRALSREKRLPRPVQLQVKFGHPMHFHASRKEVQQCTKARLKQIYQEVADQIMEAIEELEPHEDCEHFP